MSKKEKYHRNVELAPSFILLNLGKEWRHQLGATRAVECKQRKDISDVLSRATDESLWISPRSNTTDRLLQAMSHLSAGRRTTGRRFGNLLMLEPPRAKVLPFLEGLFLNVVGGTSEFKFLPNEQLREVLTGNPIAARDLFIGGVADTDCGLLTLVRGNLERITVPLSIFRRSDKSIPDFRRLELDDYGHTVRFGGYEASSHFILYETDADYRKRANAKRRAEDKGFGPSLRRLRIQKGLSQASFPGIAEKTIGRIERGEVAKPQGRTFSIIVNLLGVAPEEIESY